MLYNLLLQDEVLKEIQNAFDWYEAQRDNLGNELLDEIDACYQNLIKHPEHYSYINFRYRRIKTNRFPYIFIFEVNEDTINIVHFRHIKQKPL